MIGKVNSNEKRGAQLTNFLTIWQKNIYTKYIIPGTLNGQFLSPGDIC